jgi:adenylosuccinate synthase
MVNGVTKLVMTKADVLDAFEDLNVCTSYIINDKKTETVPFQMAKMTIAPELKSFKGWKTAIDSFRSASQLPVAMKEYVSFINSYLGVNINYISNGPGREQLIEIV